MNTTIFKIVKIISDYQIVVNGGFEHGIKKGDILEVYILGDEIIDPDTKESLGTLDTVKETLKVINVFQKMCVCINSQYDQPILALNMSSILGPKTKRLNVDSTQISGGLSDDTKIRVGDLVRKSLG